MANWRESGDTAESDIYDDMPAAQASYSADVKAKKEEEGWDVYHFFPEQIHQCCPMHKSPLWKMQAWYFSLPHMLSIAIQPS